MGQAETETALIEVKTGYGPWRITYKDGTPVGMECWEQDDRDGHTIAHHRLNLTQVVRIIPAEETR